MQINRHQIKWELKKPVQVDASSRRAKTELDLINRSVDGDYEAFGELYVIYVSRIYRYVFYQVRDKMLAEDLTEEIFMKAWKAFDKYKGKGEAFTSWLYRIAHNCVVDEFRARHQFEPIDLESVDVQLAGFVEDPVQEAEKNMVRKEVAELISCLPTQQQQVVILKFMEGLDNNEIEQITGRSQGAIRIMQMRALAMLRQKIAERNNAR